MNDALTAIDERFLSDWSGLSVGRPSAIHRPRTTAEVAELVQRCRAEGRTITVQGGLTGMAGGAVPGEGDVVINLERMNAIEDIDALEGVMQVQAGATLQQVQEAAAAAGWMFALDFGARGSCQIGGNASTNAGGIRVIRYGTMRDSILGIEAVLADASVVTSLSRLVKNSTGLDPRFLFIGTEGTLGIITRLTLHLQPPIERLTAAWVCAADFAALPRLLRTLKRTLGKSLCAFEFMSGRYVQTASQLTGIQAPLQADGAWHVLIEASSAAGQPIEEVLHEALAHAIETGELNDCALASNEVQREAFWRIREAIPEIFTHFQSVAKLDIGLPWAHTAQYLQQLEAQLRAKLPEAEHLFLGHLGDNNFHLISGPLDQAGIALVDKIAYSALRPYRGTVSAEHGIGRLKKNHLSVTRSAEEIELMRRLKRALDPSNMLNPGRIID